MILLSTGSESPRAPCRSGSGRFTGFWVSRAGHPRVLERRNPAASNPYDTDCDATAATALASTANGLATVAAAAGVPAVHSTRGNDAFATTAATGLAAVAADTTPEVSWATVL